MGSILSGVFGGGGTTKETVNVDAATKALNQLRLEQLQQLFGVSSYSDYAKEQPDIYKPTARTQALLDQVSKLTSSDNLMSLQDYINLGLDEGKNYISQVATPEILQTAALQGLEGGGYVPESIAKATAGIALPFLQSLPAMQQSTASTAATLFPLTDFSRALQEADLTRRQGVVTTGLSGIPFQPETTTKGSTNQQPLFNYFGQGSATGGLTNIFTGGLAKSS